ncbi:hypothetical protein C7B67_16405 [filamentous cyanobacterium Phorm 6]|nr:hypothetical protein C7B67_16405 [filamentous cyanobacterium Phorm 6]
MTTIEFNFRTHQFHLTKVANWESKYKFSSSRKSNFVNSIGEGISYCKFDIDREAEQIREYNAEVPETNALYPDDGIREISLFAIPEEIQGLVDLDRMEFINGVYSGNIPYTADNFEF